MEAGNVIRLNEKMERLAEVKTDLVALRSVAQTFELPATIESPPDKTGAVFSLVSGVVARVLVDVGDNVKAGQVLALVNSPELGESQSAFLNARLKLNEARRQTNLVSTRLKLDRLNEQRACLLYEEGIAARRELELAQSKVASTEAELVIAQSESAAAGSALNAARARLHALSIPEPEHHGKFTTELGVRAPVSGTVIVRNVYPGQSVGSDGQTSNAKNGALLILADLSKVWLMVELPQSAVPLLKLGSDLEFKSEVAPGRRFSGRITRLGTDFHLQSHTARVRAVVDNRQGLLKPGMLVVAVLHDTRGTMPELSLPLSAVQIIDGKEHAFVFLGNHRYEKRRIALGYRTRLLAVVKGGLSPGERVVTHGSFCLKSEIARVSLGAAL